MELFQKGKNKVLCTTFCIVHSGFSADFEHHRSPVVRWFAERLISRNPLRHHTIYRYAKLRNMIIIELIPKKGIEHINFGMTRDEVRSIMVSKYNAGTPEKRNDETECYFENSLQFSYEDDETLSFIEISSYPPIAVRILGINTWEIDGKELLELIKQNDTMNEQISEGGYNPIFQENIITLYELDEQYDVIGEFKGEKWGAIGIGDSRYYESICMIYG